MTSSLPKDPLPIQSTAPSAPLPKPKPTNGGAKIEKSPTKDKVESAAGAGAFAGKTDLPPQIKTFEPKKVSFGKASDVALPAAARAFPAAIRANAAAAAATPTELARKQKEFDDAAAKLKADSATRPLMPMARDDFDDVEKPELLLGKYEIIQPDDSVYMIDEAGLVFKPSVEEADKGMLCLQIAERVGLGSVLPLIKKGVATVEVNPSSKSYDPKKKVLFMTSANGFEPDKGLKFTVKNEKSYDVFKKTAEKGPNGALIFANKSMGFGIDKKQFLINLDGTCNELDPYAPPTPRLTPTIGSQEAEGRNTPSSLALSPKPSFSMTSDSDNEEADATDSDDEKIEQKKYLLTDGEGNYFLVPVDDCQAQKEEITGIVQEKITNIFQGDNPKKPLNLLDPSPERSAFEARLDQNDFADAFLLTMLLRPQDGKASNLGEDTNVLFQMTDPANPNCKLKPKLIDLAETLPADNAFTDDLSNYDENVVSIQTGLMGFPHARKALTATERQHVINRIQVMTQQKVALERELRGTFASQKVFKEKHLKALTEVINRMEKFVHQNMHKSWTLEDLFFYTFPEYKKQWDQYDIIFEQVQKLDPATSAGAAAQTKQQLVGPERRAKYVGMRTVEESEQEIVGRTKQLIKARRTTETPEQRNVREA